MTGMTKTQIAELKAPSTKYAPSAYSAVIDRLLKSKRELGYCRVEEDFPGVKPQHVAHMLKQLKGENELDVEISATYGVCITKRAVAPAIAA